MPTRRKHVTKKRPARWNDAPRQRNPLGLLLVLVGAGGLLYVACAPRDKVPTGAPPPSASRTVEPPSVPRGRYEPRRPVVAVVEQKPPADAEPVPDAAQKTGVEGPVGSAGDMPKPGKEIVEPEVRLGGTPVPETLAIRMPRVQKGEFARNPNADGVVALSFDGCYDDKPLPKILVALDHHGYKATFFVAGRFAQRYPGSVKRIADAGMELGNHSWSHPKFTALTDTQIDSQLSRTNDLIRQISGQTPTLFRPPFGDRDDRVRRLVAADGFHTVCWALDSWDSVKKGITSEEIAKRVLDRVKPGDVVLLHVGSEATANALPVILEGLDSRGLRVVPVSELMKG